MEKSNITAKKCLGTTQSQVVREYNIGGKSYVVKSIFVGDKDIKEAILTLAEKKALREMGLDCAVT